MYTYIILHNIFICFLLYCFAQAVIVYMLLKHYYGQTLSLRSFLCIILVPTSIPRVISRYKPYDYKTVSMFKYKKVLLNETKKQEKRLKELEYKNHVEDITRRYSRV